MLHASLYVIDFTRALNSGEATLNWQVWQVGFLFVFSMQFDREKRIKSRAVPVPVTTESFREPSELGQPE